MIDYIGAGNFDAWFYASRFSSNCTNAEEITSDIQGVQQVANQFHFKGQLWITEFGYGNEWHSVRISSIKPIKLLNTMHKPYQWVFLVFVGMLGGITVVIGDLE